MAIELVLLRHAEAADKEAGRSDFDRELTSKGRKQAERMGRQLRQRQLQPDLVITSPAPRARQTADLASEAMGVAPTALRKDMAIYENDVPDLLDILRRHGGKAKRVMLVGHNPSLSALAGLLCGRGAVELGKGDAAVLSGPGSWDKLGQDPLALAHHLKP